MKIWISKNSEVSVREQIVAQILLGIASQDFQIGERLASTRQLARRFQIHPNTVLAAYRELADKGLVEFRKGSGVYVRENISDETRQPTLEFLVADFFRRANSAGFTADSVEKQVDRFLKNQSRHEYIVIESDPDLRAILTGEIRKATGRRVQGISVEDLTRHKFTEYARPVAMLNRSVVVEPLIGGETKCLYLKSNSVSDSMAGETRPSADDLIALVSGWPKFLLLAKTFLLAAGVDSEALIPRSTHELDWWKGLQTASMIICDSLTAESFPNDSRLCSFRLIADSSLDELKSMQ
jgi:DNA-binding transcriptional regulator YhcF (GntR family)